MRRWNPRRGTWNVSPSALEQVREEFVDPGSGESLIQNVSRTIGAEYTTRDFEKSKGYISVEIMAPDKRSEPGPRNSEIAARWTELIGPIPEAERFRIYADSNMRRGDDDEESLTIELRGPASPTKIAVANKSNTFLEGFDEDFSSVWAKINRGQDELELTLKPMGVDLGLTQAMLAQQVRQAFYGEEAQRVQRGIDLVRAMVRLPKLDRESLHTLEQLKVKTPSGANVPLSTVATIHFTKAPSRVERKNGAEILDIGAQPVDEEVDVLGIAKQITPQLDALCHDADLSYQFTGYVAEAEETRKQTILGAVIMLMTLYGLLAIPLKVRHATDLRHVGSAIRRYWSSTWSYHHGLGAVLSFRLRYAGLSGYLRQRYAGHGGLRQPSPRGRDLVARCCTRRRRPTVPTYHAHLSDYVRRFASIAHGPFVAGAVLDPHGGISGLRRSVRHFRNTVSRPLFPPAGARYSACLE